jgi:CelD/BcsL family acetyltransferase involved in cellulose biosynthesis
VGTWESLQSPYVPLPSDVEALWARLHSKFKANLRRRRKKLEELGEVTVERVEGGKDLEAFLETGYALEAGGWKGQRGTAIVQDPATRGFYSELARCASYRGWLSLYFLKVGGRAVAFQYGLTYGGRYLLLKPGYDEGLKACSPGQLLMEEVLKECCRQGLSEFDFLGPDMVWKRDWTDQVRVHTWLYVFRDNAFGRALCAAKFRWGPRVKGAVASWRR